MEEDDNDDIILKFPTPSKHSFHNDTLKHFNEKLYKNILTASNITSKEQSYNFKESGKKQGFRLEKHNDIKTYFLQSKDLKKLPLKILETEKDVFRTDVLRIVSKCNTVKIPSEKTTSFRNLINWVCNFEHDNPLHWRLYKILIITGVIDRINFRIQTNSGFGKDSVVNAIIELVNKTANIYGATFAKMEYYLLNDFLLFNEIGGLKDSEKKKFQTFFLETGDFSNTYNKHSRKTSKTKERYDISKTSVGIAGNFNNYYYEKDMECFVEMFTKAVDNRFLPLKMRGLLVHDFSEQFNVSNVMTKNKTFYKKIISTINWYRDNAKTLDKVDWGYNPTRDFPYGTNRAKLSYERVCKYISFYAKGKEEYKELSDELFKCYIEQYKDDQAVLNKNKEVVVEDELSKYEEEGVV